MENDFPIKKINAKEEVEFHNKGKKTRLRHSWWWQLEQIYVNTGCKNIQNWADITSDSDNDEDDLEIL